MDKHSISQTTATRNLTCPACGAALHPPTPHSCGRSATERRIAAALERAVQRGHYAQHVGTSPRLAADVFYVKSTSGMVSGYTVYVYRRDVEGSFAYLPGLYARCECRAAQNGSPCDHGAKASRASARRAITTGSILVTAKGA